MSSIVKKLRQLIQLPTNKSQSFIHFWKGAFYGLFALALVIMTLSGLFFRTGLPKIIMVSGTLLIGICGFALFRVLGALLHKGITKIPVFIFSLLFATSGIFVLARFIRFGFPEFVFYPGAIVVIALIAILSGSVFVLISKSYHSVLYYTIAIFASLIVLGFGIYYLSQDGKDPFPISYQHLKVKTLADQGISNPAEAGSYAFEYFTYGSGTDKQRDEFRDGVKYKTPTVDASRLLPEWKGSKAKWRERYWGFGVKEFPLNGRVWLPQGKGPFPIILIVHGNHGMEEYSDPGYAYLGGLLSSRGFITVSVDENFVNGTWSGDFMGKEMPTRGWLLLKHLEQWRNWNADKSHNLYQKADLDNVILVGHSRGGEAAPIAANFNTLPYFPDDANEKFDFNFGIKGLVAIAPTDKRYVRRINLADINYLTLQGSYDSDEASFFGFRQYQRIKLLDSTFHFKSGVYIHRANHGQFNSVWGKYDGGPPSSWLLNVQPLIKMEEQQEIAKVYIAAFAETVFNQNKKYLDLFKNSAVANTWLPETIILNTYEDNNAEILANYEEDIDVTTGTKKGIHISGENLKIWREQMLQFRDKDTQSNNAVVLGWDNSDSVKVIPSYTITLPASIPVNSNASLLISLGRGDEKELKKKDNSDEEESEETSDDLQFDVQLTDSLGHVASLDISSIKKIAPRLKVQYVKLKGVNEEDFGNVWEPTLQTFEIPLRNILSSENVLNNIKNINFIFSKSKKGVIILDEIGLSSQP